MRHVNPPLRQSLGRSEALQGKLQNRADQYKRNLAIIDAYLACDPVNDICVRFALSRKRIWQIVKAAGATRDTRACASAAVSRAWADSERAERHRAAIRQANSKWPDCPPDKWDDYRWLRLGMNMRADEARAIIERAAA